MFAKLVSVVGATLTRFNSVQIDYVDKSTTYTTRFLCVVRLLTWANINYSTTEYLTNSLLCEKQEGDIFDYHLCSQQKR